METGQTSEAEVRSTLVPYKVPVWSIVPEESFMNST